MKFVFLKQTAFNRNSPNASETKCFPSLGFTCQILKQCMLLHKFNSDLGMAIGNELKQKYTLQHFLRGKDAVGRLVRIG